jgi:hypothetical protein
VFRNRILVSLFSSALFFGTAIAQDEPRFRTIDYPGVCRHNLILRKKVNESSR